MRFFLFAGGVTALLTVAAWSFAVERGALWQVINACVVDKKLTGSPLPCLDVDLGEGRQRGHVVLREPVSGDLILAPTRKSPGVEDPFLSSADAPNYFAAAWRARSFLSEPDGKPPDRERVGLVANPRLRRTQDQLHIHIGCLVRAAQASVRTLAARLQPGQWTRVGAVVPASDFWALRLDGADLDGVNPFALADEELARKERERSQRLIAVAGVRVAGDDGFLILATWVHAPNAGYPIGADDLLNPRCPAEPKRPG